MTRLLFCLFLAIPFNSYSQVFDMKKFYITFGERPNSAIRMVRIKYGQEYGMLASMLWFSAEEELGQAPEYSGLAKIYFTWEF